MSELGEKALIRLLDQAEASKRAPEQITLPFTAHRFPQYFDSKDVDRLESLHAYLRYAERAGAIRIEWQRFQEGAQIARLRVGNLELLAAHVGRTLLSERLAAAETHLREQLQDAPPWLGEAAARMMARWQSGKHVHGLCIDDCGRAADLIRLAQHLERVGTLGLDMRALSVRLFGDSKHIESLAGAVASLYRSRPEYSGMDTDEILADLALTKHPWPVLMAGQVELQLGVARLGADVIPYVGVAPDAVTAVGYAHRPAYLLTIENLSSFNTYTRTIQDGGVVLFTSGFPSRALQQLYKMLLRVLPADVPVYHWGDTDLGGFRILHKLQEYADEACPGRVIVPHLMPARSSDPKPTEKTLSQGARDEIEALRKRNPAMDAAIASSGWDRDYRPVEQEGIEPRSPRKNANADQKVLHRQ